MPTIFSLSLRELMLKFDIVALHLLFLFATNVCGRTV